MSHLIDLKHPFQIKNLNSIKEYLFILKNILRVASQKKARQKPSGFSLPVRWSSLFNNFVVDFGSNKQRDILGIHLDNLSLHYNESTDAFNSIVHLLNKLKNCNNSDHLFEKYKLKKNENRFFNFIVNKDKVYITGLYNRCQNKKRSGIYSSKGKMSILIDDSIDFLVDVQKSLDFLLIPENYELKESYHNIYLNFFEALENLECNVKETEHLEKRIVLKDYIYKKLEIKKIGIMQYTQIINKSMFIDDSMLFWFLIYHITLLFNHVFLKSLNSTNVDNIIVYDIVSDETIKIVSRFKTNVEKKEKKLNAPLLPVSF